MQNQTTEPTAHANPLTSPLVPIFDPSKPIMASTSSTAQIALHTSSITAWEGALTFFINQFDTTPSMEVVNGSWPEIVEVLASESGPRIIHQKTDLPYFLPCQLKETELVGKTLARAIAQGLPTIGKQRSGNHLTTTTLLVFDMDGINAVQLEQIKARFKQAGIAAACWSSHSIGAKPGIRCRIIVPVDKLLEAPYYCSAHHWANDNILLGLADPTGASLAQCQGVWAVSNDRKEHAFKWVLAGGVLVLPAEALARPARPRVEAIAKLVIHDQAKFDQEQQVLAMATDLEILKALKFTKVVRDGAGRENAVLRLAGILRKACLQEGRIDLICTFFGEHFCAPSLDDDVIRSRAQRYTSQAGCESSLSMLARQISVLIVEEAVAHNDWQRCDDAEDIPYKYLNAHHQWALDQFGFIGGAA
jgi:hypothetical protein